MQKDVGSGVSDRASGDKREMNMDVVSVFMAAEASRLPSRSKMGIMSPRKRIRKGFANEVETSYLKELD